MTGILIHQRCWNHQRNTYKDCPQTTRWLFKTQHGTPHSKLSFRLLACEPKLAGFNGCIL